LSGNPNAIPLLEANQEKINWVRCSANPKGIDLLVQNQQITALAYQNPSIFM
jgi:hypothetical protein